jgi:hypothetical protein
VEPRLSAMFHESAAKLGTDARSGCGVPFVSDDAGAIAGEPGRGSSRWASGSRRGNASGLKRKSKERMGFGCTRCSVWIWNRFGGCVVLLGRLGGTAEDAGGSFSTSAQVTDRRYYCSSGKVRETRKGG